MVFRAGAVRAICLGWKDNPALRQTERPDPQRDEFLLTGDCGCDCPLGLMSNQDALEIIAFLLNRLTLNKVEVSAVNAALQHLKTNLVDGDPLDELEKKQ